MFNKNVKNRCALFFMLSICISLFPASGSFAGSAVGALGKTIWDWGAGGEGSNTIMRYGNWLGPGWWGGSELPNKVGMLPPIDDLDAVAQKHDFGYELAEKLGKGRPNVEAYYKAMADFIAVCDTRDLPPDPTLWRHPSPNPEQAKVFMDRLDTAFTYYQQRMHELKAAIPTKIDKSNPDIPDEALDSLIDDKEFEKRVLARIKEWSKAYAEFQAAKSKANPSTPAGTGRNEPQKSGTAAKEIDAEILDAICRCSSACSARGFYSVTPVKESPSCEDPGNGPCVCSGMGCLRSVMSPACIVRAYQETKGQTLSVSEVVQFIDKYQGKKPQVQDPATIPPIVRKGEALQMSINVPGKPPEKWLWRSDDAKTFQATRQTPGSGPATETVKLQAPSLGHLVFERSNGSKILGMRELMNGGFTGGIADGFPQGTTITAYMISDPGPATDSTAVSPALSGSPAPSSLMAAPTTPAVKPPEATDIVGTWTWINGVVTFRKDGTGSHSSGYTNTWKPSATASRTYDVIWSHGYKDTLVLSPDGMTINGTNNEGVKHTARRQDLVPASEATAAASKPAIVFAKPARVETKGQWGIFESVNAPMKIKGQAYSAYYLQHPGNDGPTSIYFALQGALSRLKAKVGIDQSLHPEVPIRGGGTVRITAKGDGRVLWTSGVITISNSPQPVEIDVRGVRELVLTVDDTGDGTAFDWLVWADPVFE